MKRPSLFSTTGFGKGMRILFGLFILYASLHTLFLTAKAWPGLWSVDAFVLLIAGAEVVAVAFFLVPRFYSLGEGLLLLVFAAAAGVHIYLGEGFFHLVLYALIVLLFSHIEGLKTQK